MEKHSNNLSLIERADYVPYAFNDFLQLLVENGVVGLSIFIALLYTVFKNGLKRIHTRSPFLIGSMGALLSLIIAGFFSYPFEIPSIWLLFLFFISMLSYLIGRDEIKLAGNGSLLKIIAVATGVVMVLVLKNEIHLIKAKHNWKNARNLLSGRLFEQAVVAYRAVLDELPNRPGVLLGYGKALYMTGEFAQSATVLEKASTRTSDPMLYTNLGNAYVKLNQNEQAERAYKKAISIIPNKLYPRYLLAKMYLTTGDSAEARKTARYIVRMPVPVSSPASRQITAEMNELLTKN